MNRKEIVVPCSSRLMAYNHRTKKKRNMTVYEGVTKLLANNPKAQELFSSNKVDVTVQMNSKGSVLGISLTPKDVVSSSDDSSSTDMETLPTAASDDEEVPNKNADKLEDIDNWWKSDSSGEEEDLDFTLVLEEDNEAECMETNEILDVIEATQLPPGRISGVLTNAETQLPVESKSVEPDSTVSLAEERDGKDSDDEEEPWMSCWNCRAPKPIPGIYREDGDNMRMIFCCDKPTRIKPTNTVIESSAKSYPYDSWVHHSFS